MMRNYFLLMLMALSSSLFAQDIKMLSVGSTWYYDYGMAVVQCWVEEDGIHVVDGKEYQSVEWGHDWLGAKPSNAEQAVPVEPAAAHILLREDGGRVFAHKEEFMAVMKKAYHLDEDEVFAESNGNDEVLLYDFTLQVGDRYPCKGDVFVSEIEQITCRDGLVRKVFTLNNGLKLIEGIGCINSSGEFLGYQTKGVMSEDEIQEWPVLRSFTSSSNLAYVGGDEDPAYPRRMLVLHRIWKFAPSSTDPASIFYEISGSYTQCLSRLGSDGIKDYLVINRGYDQLHIRENDGKVYVPRSEYEQMMMHYLGNASTDGFFIEANGEDEVLLYDFTLQEGDRYPCRGDVVVSSVEDRVMRDGFPRKRLTLSNGLVLIEGIGCVNSPYDFYGYQNATTANTLGDEYASGSLLTSVNESEVEPRRIIFKIEDEKTTSIQGKIVNSKLSNGKCFDLQGREVQSNKVIKSQGNLPKGIYIMNGKRIVVR